MRMKVDIHPAPLPWFQLVKFPFHVGLKDYVKGLPGSTWVPASRCWQVAIEVVPLIQAVAARIS